MPHGAEHAVHSLLPQWLFAGLLLTYLALAWRRRWHRRPWRAARALSFACGVALLMLAWSPPVATWGAQDLRGHMVQHLLLGMVAPLFLVLAAPGLLLLKSLPPAGSRRLVRFLGRRPVRGLVHPGTALTLDIGAMYLLYLTPLYAMTLGSSTLHHLMHVHFMIAGYLFTWSVIGPDPAPHRPSRPVRLLVLFLATALHATLGKLMYGYGHPRGAGYDAMELREAAQIMYYGGDLVELILIVVFIAAWSRRGGLDGLSRLPVLGRLAAPV